MVPPPRAVARATTEVPKRSNCLCPARSAADAAKVTLPSQPSICNVVTENNHLQPTAEARLIRENASSVYAAHEVRKPSRRPARFLQTFMMWIYFRNL